MVTFPPSNDARMIEKMWWKEYEVLLTLTAIKHNTKKKMMNLVDLIDMDGSQSDSMPKGLLNSCFVS